MTCFATTLGLFPIPDWAKAELTERKGRQKDDLISGDEGAGISEVYDSAREEVLEQQATAGLSYLVEGQLRWDDMLCHPLVVHDGVETGGLVRYYDNNNFYRETVVRDPLGADGDVSHELEAADELIEEDRLQAVLPGPYSLAQLATDATYGSEGAFLEALGAFLAGEIEAFPPVDALFLLDPSLAVSPPSSSESLVKALESILQASATADIPDVILQTYWGVPPVDVYETLLEQDGLGLGLDLVNGGGPARALLEDVGSPATLSLGLVDGQNTLMESPEAVAETAEDVLATAGEVEQVYLTPNTELFYLPTNRAAEKMETVAAAADRVEVDG